MCPVRSVTRLIFHSGLALLLLGGGLGGVIGTPAQGAAAMQRENLPTGSAWTAVLNGIETTLTFDSQDDAGNIAGTINNDPITGFWDREDQKVTFIRVLTSAQPNANRMQVFTGYLFEQDGSCPGGGGDFCFWLTGHYVAFADAGGSGPRSEFGWYAFLFGIA